MKAAVLRELAQPLVIEDRPIPAPEAGEVVIRIHACGVCHSDLHLALGEWEQLKPITKTPLVLGHEIAGEIAAIGPGVTGFTAGDRVGVPWLYYTCDECEFCRAGQETLCTKQKVTGAMVDGGYQEYMRALASHTAKLPANLGFAEAAPLLCAGVTVYKALRVAEAKAGQRLTVFGVGGLGHLAVQLGKALGLEVGAVDVSEEKLQLARECGADWTVNATAPTPHKLLKAQGGGAHIAMVTSGSSAAYELALRGLRRAGTLAVVGMTPDPIKVSTVALVSGEYKIVASAVGSRQDLRDVLQLAAEGKIRCHHETRPLDDINDILTSMKEGRLNGRVVLTM
ncbi:MAG: alcohol dehydrogenase catalytic domain-containing protein [Blastocatellia bacterium]